MKRHTAHRMHALVTALLIQLIFSAQAQTNLIEPYRRGLSENIAASSVREAANTSLPVLETGFASWYGPQFDGQRSASGEIFRSSDLTAAHPSLPFNTRVLVTNLYNNKSVIVRVNDRGPNQDIHPDRVIDLSEGTARALDMMKDGVVQVRLQLVDTDVAILTSDGTLAKDWSKQTFSIQIASYFNEAAAKHRASSVPAGWVQSTTAAGVTLHRVFSGKFERKADAASAQRDLRLSGISDTYVKQIQNVVYTAPDEPLIASGEVRVNVPVAHNGSDPTPGSRPGYTSPARSEVIAPPVVRPRERETVYVAPETEPAESNTYIPSVPSVGSVSYYGNTTYSAPASSGYRPATSSVIADRNATARSNYRQPNSTAAPYRPSVQYTPAIPLPPSVVYNSRRSPTSLVGYTVASARSRSIKGRSRSFSW